MKTLESTRARHTREQARLDETLEISIRELMPLVEDLKEHKKIWMQRLNTAYAASDMREMLQLEMEWLDEETTNLAAGDEKLQVYCMVLKKQIAGLKRQTHDLVHETQYGPLQRFREPFHGTLANPASIKRELRAELERHREMVGILARNDANSRRRIYAWADEHAFRSRCPC
jgi:phage shock protein A